MLGVNGGVGFVSGLLLRVIFFLKMIFQFQLPLGRLLHEFRVRGTTVGR